MSHHLDSPLARQDIRLDITDLYVFRGDTGTAFVINVCHSLGGDVAAPGFHPEGMYEFKVDLDADLTEDLTYRIVFGERDSSGHQAYTLVRVSGPAAVDPFSEGIEVLTGTTGTESISPSGVRVWAGRAGDPFFVEADVVHAIGHAVYDGTGLDLGDWEPSKATNLFAGQNVYSLVVELPDSEFAPRGIDGRIGVWAVASLQTDAGGWRSINRVGLPMIPPLLTQFDEQLGNDINTGAPRDDWANYGERVAAKFAAVVAANKTATDPDAQGYAIARRLFPNILPYRVGSAAAFSFADFNGRSLIDNCPDVMFSLAMNAPVNSGLDRTSVTPAPTTTFPYVPVLTG